MATEHYVLDPKHSSFDVFDTQMVHDIWKEKYAQPNEHQQKDTWHRVAMAIFPFDEGKSNLMYLKCFEALNKGLWMPGGRILAGAGTSKRVTLMNCYVSRTITDDMVGIMDAHKEAALTMQQGGGIGMNFGTIRPAGAILRRTGSKASGPLHFMDMWDSMCLAIRSAGDRRGAMMGIMSDTHPDLPAFIEAKRKKGRLTQFNVSIGVSDAFMDAIENDAEWLLYFHEEPAERSPELAINDFMDDDDVYQYVYSVWKARDLWNMILRNTYEWAEPGIIFIDRVNAMNNLQYCETIAATNPCGEQPLPPYGTCNLGAVNLARMVKNPFTDEATFDFGLLEGIVELGVHFLDRVIDVTAYPLEEQATEEMNKRRLGLGHTGLADCLAQMGLKYGSTKAIQLTEDIMQAIAITAYGTSTKLAETYQSFPLYDESIITYGFIKERLSDGLRDLIVQKGLRNGVLLTVAPTGTTSIVFGNISSGCEPVFQHFIKRNVRQIDESFKTYYELGFGVRFYGHCVGIPEEQLVKDNGDGSFTLHELPDYMVTTSDLTVEEHIRMQAAVQKWVDASVSKTVNCPADMSFEYFAKVYELAWHSGCKGCTTYRPSDVRGAILEDVTSKKSSPTSEALAASIQPKLVLRPDILSGSTHKIRWPSMNASMYITVNFYGGKPYEMFFASKDARHSDWMTALTLMISGILRSGIDPQFIAQELKQVTSMHDTAWINGKFYASPVAYIGHVIDQVINGNAPTNLEAAISEDISEPVKGLPCPTCGAPALVMEEGCRKCKSCGYSQCG